MRSFIAAVTSLVAGGGIVMAINGQLWFAPLILPAVLYIVWLIADYRSRVSVKH